MMDKILDKSRQVWDDFAKKIKNQHLVFPDESLIRIFCGNYVRVPKPPAKILDHGFRSGNSMLFFYEKGYEVYGCEVVRSLIDVAKNAFKKFDGKAHFTLINGTKLDYKDNFFDIIVSWNAIHYNGTKNAIQAIIAEFHRILKPGGVLIVSTLHPTNSVLKRGKDDGYGTYVLEKTSKFDNRQGLTFYCPKTHKEFMSLWKIFSEIKYGYYNFDLFQPEYSQAARLIYAIK